MYKSKSTFLISNLGYFMFTVLYAETVGPIKKRYFEFEAKLKKIGQIA